MAALVTISVNKLLFSYILLDLFTELIQIKASVIYNAKPSLFLIHVNKLGDNLILRFCCRKDPTALYGQNVWLYRQQVERGERKLCRNSKTWQPRGRLCECYNDWLNSQSICYLTLWYLDIIWFTIGLGERWTSKGKSSISTTAQKLRKLKFFLDSRWQ